jgi:hypothetical protein
MALYTAEEERMQALDGLVRMMTRIEEQRLVKGCLVGLAVLGALPLTVLGATNCKAKINTSDGSVLVSASDTSALLRWGDASGAETNIFDNAAQCISSGSATKCLLGPAGSLTARTPPAGCVIYLDDGTAACSVLIKKCTPGVRDAAALQAQIAALEARVDALETLLGSASLADSGMTLRFTGVNVQVVSGAGATDGPMNGKGNLIIGYNEDDVTPLNRTGSHNLVLGTVNSYSAYGGIVAGSYNTISGPYATVTGGQDNLASAQGSSVSGGISNTASEIFAAVSGGIANTANDAAASVTGGACNIAGSGAAPVCGGIAAQSVSGGIRNVASGANASVSGGELNVASGDEASVSGGSGRSATTEHDWAAGSLLEPN